MTDDASTADGDTAIADDTTAVAEVAEGHTAIAEGDATIAEGEDTPTTVSGAAGFSVHLENFEGPFDLLLQLIGKHKMDVTEVALSQVTDEFIAHIRGAGDAWDLGQATEFLVVAATLLDLKAARLLPQAEVDDEEDLALLEARDLLFARLLQYRAYKQMATHLAGLESAQAKRFPRAVSLEPRFADVLPEVLLGVGLDQFVAIAVEAFRPKEPPTVTIDHLHQPRVSVREQAVILGERLRRQGKATFRALSADCENTLEVVARFLALLQLYRGGLVAFDQLVALGELHVRWTAAPDAQLTGVAVDEYDDGGAPARGYDGAPDVDDALADRPHGTDQGVRETADRPHGTDQDVRETADRPHGTGDER